MQLTGTFVALFSIALAGFAAAQSTMTVATPASVVQCQPAQLSWSGGTAPYFPSIIPGSQPGAAAMKEFPSQPGTSLTWKVDISAGTSITLQMRDSTGAVQYSAAVIIQSSSDSSCVNNSVTATGSGGAPAPTTTAPAPGGSSSAGSATGTPTPRTSSSGTASSSSPTQSRNAASSVVTSGFAVPALAALLGATLF